MIRFSPSVKLKGMQPQLTVAMVVVDQQYERSGINDCLITSVNDSKHMVGSKHYEGAAFDIRTKHIPFLKKHPIVNAVVSYLGPLYDVVFEDEGKDNEHLHVEYDPKPK